MNSQQPIAMPLPLGQSVYLSLDAAMDSIPIYNDLVTSYRWLEKTRDYALGAASFLGHNSLSRSMSKVAKSRRRPATSTSYTAAPQ